MSLIQFILSLLLGAFGWLVSHYFRLHHQERIPEQVWWIPRIFQMRGCRCDEIVDTRFGQTLGRSNAWWGLWYYPLLVLMLAGHWFFDLPGIGLLFIIVLLAFAFSVYLAWGLYILRVFCRPCLAAHLVNAALFAILLDSVYPLFITR
ncbi:MAG: vitamin K epoxide reductase family protein [Fidelibacterota bacterium]|nr:MAG: vitamin K epoxide reductase family protein [Candidatus Neomarinimicrobiota bacterium]